MTSPSDSEVLGNYLLRIPSIIDPISIVYTEAGNWSANFKIDIYHPLAWQVIQELGYVLNALSPDEPLPVTFLPVSPPPYSDGGPSDQLGWVIQSKTPDFTPSKCADILWSRLPRPVEDMEQWKHES
jgi:hypothetical protein